MSLSDVLSQKLADTQRVASVVGIFVTMAGPLARVNVQGATVDLRCDGWYPPIPGMPVRVDTVDAIMRVVGPAQTLPARAVVTASVAGGSRAEVNADGKTYVLPVLAPYSPLVSDVVVINWMSGHILGEEAAAPATTDPGTIPGGGAPFTDLLIQPASSGKYDTSWDNWWGGTEVQASDNNKGIWVYGGRFAALAGANVAALDLCLPSPIVAAGAAYVGLHVYPSIPGGEPSITSLTPLSARAGWVALPASWGNYLRDNPDAGIGVTSGAGNNRWPGVGQAGGSQSGWLRFAGTR